MIAPSQNAVSPEWFRQSFGALYPIIYAHRTVEAAAPEAEFAAKMLRLSPDDHVLDLCCGNGRHMVHLLRHTPHVIGLDYSPELLQLAKRSLERLVRADMRAVPFATAFDAVVSFFTSFGYFATEEENLRVVREVARVLRSGGRFFIDYLNADYVRKTLVPESVREYKEYVIEERRWIDETRTRVNKVTRAVRAGAVTGEWGESVQLYTETEFRTLLARGGLCVDRVFGDYGGAALDAARPRMIVVGHKE